MSTDNKVFKLKSSDDKIFEVDKLVACQLQTLQPLLEDTCPDTILLPNITGKILSKVIEYCRYHGESSQQIFDEELAKNKIKEWEVEFVKVDDDILFLLMDASSLRSTLLFFGIMSLMSSLDWLKQYCIFWNIVSTLSLSIYFYGQVPIVLFNVQLERRP